MKQSLRQRGGSGRSLPHAAILLILLVVTGGLFFRGIFPSQSEASTSDLLLVTPIAGVRQVPGEYLTIQAAVDAAQYGETVLIAPGVYHERVSINGKKITLRGIDGELRAQIVGDGRQGASRDTRRRVHTRATAWRRRHGPGVAGAAQRWTL